MIEEVNVLLYAILINLDLKSCMWPVGTLLDSTDSRLVVPLCFCLYDPITFCKVTLRESFLETAMSENAVEGFVFPLGSWSEH